MLAEIGRALALIIGGDVEVWQITGVSFAVALAALLGAVALGLPLAYRLASSERRSRIGMWIAHNLAALPTVVIGLTLYLVLSASGPLGWTHLLYTRTAMSVAQFVLALPLVVAVVLGALRRLPPSAREVLFTHGVTRARQMRWLLWEVKSAVVSGAFLAFSRAFTELNTGSSWRLALRQFARMRVPRCRSTSCSRSRGDSLPVELMIGVGPEVIHATGPDHATFWGLSSVLDFMFWPRKNVGWYVEPGYEMTFRGGTTQHGLGIEAGLLIGR